MEIQRELTILKELQAKYARYLKKYFGFTLKDIAGEIGISSAHLTNILRNRRKLDEALYPRLIEAMQKFKVEEKIKGFEESEYQCLHRSLRQRTNN